MPVWLLRFRNRREKRMIMKMIPPMADPPPPEVCFRYSSAVNLPSSREMSTSVA
jgi:hypothetical protein